MSVTMFGYVILIGKDFCAFISISTFSLVLVSIEKIYQTLKTVLNHICKRFDVLQKYSAAVFPVFGNMAKSGLSCLIYYIV